MTKVYIVAILLSVSNFFAKLIPIAVFFILLFLYTKTAGPIPFSVTSVSTTKSDAFTVSGEGKVNVIPDTALINAGIEANGSSVEQAQSQINQVINKTSEEIKRLGVDAEDIKTVNYSINPTYDFTSGRQRITGYVAQTTLQIKVRKAGKINSIIDAATASGANQIGGVTFEVDDKTKALNEARELAVTDAKKKAEDAAKIAGFRLGKIINYQESTTGEPRPVPLSLSVTEDKQATQVEPGSSEISITVTLSYEII